MPNETNTAEDVIDIEAAVTKELLEEVHAATKARMRQGVLLVDAAVEALVSAIAKRTILMAKLAIEHDELYEGVEDLILKHNDLVASHNDLIEKFEDLTVDYDALAEELEALQEEHETLQAAFDASVAQRKSLGVN